MNLIERLLEKNIDKSCLRGGSGFSTRTGKKAVMESVLYDTELLMIFYNGNVSTANAKCGWNKQKVFWLNQVSSLQNEVVGRSESEGKVFGFFFLLGFIFFPDLRRKNALNVRLAYMSFAVFNVFSATHECLYECV